MTQLSANISAQQVKLSVYELDSLTAHPTAAVKCADYLSANLYENAVICLSSDPAIALAITNFCRQQDKPIDLAVIDWTSLLKQLSKKELIKQLLTLKAINPQDQEALALNASLLRQNGIRAYAAKLIAKKTIAEKENEAFNAAIFADVGLFALAELFTKSLLILRQASSEQNAPLHILQQERLGITDNILSQMLLQKWRLGDTIADAGWLFKTKAAALIDRLPAGNIISLVRMAALLSDAKEDDDFQILTQKLSLTNADINEIKDQLAIFAGQIDGLLGLNADNPSQFYSETIKQIYLNQLAARPYAGQEFEAFVQKFSDNIRPSAGLIDIAVISAKAIYEISSAENICVFIALPQQPKLFLTAAVKNDGILKTAITESPPTIQSGDCLPIKSGNENIGGIICSGAISDINQLELISDFLAKMVSIINKIEERQSIAQSAIDCLSQTRPQSPAVVPQAAPKDSLTEMVAEIAAGAAHELNNPLAVISGRAQLLSQGETDEAKRTVLNQISDKAKDIHEIVGQLMNYARPPKPQIRTVSPFIVLNNALEKVNARYLSEPLDIKLENIETLGDVEADSEQVAEALAQIIYNALESYESGNGQVRIVGKEKTDAVEIQIIDTGCGMSGETLQKAMQPFFSDKPAGRQRGMGLALAESYLKNNGCSIKIESKLEKGTTVIINLPKANKN